MKKLVFATVLGLAAAAFADGYEVRDDFGGVTGDAGFWTTSGHPERQVHVRTVGIPFSITPGVEESVNGFDVFDTRVYSAVFGTFLGEFSTNPQGVLLMLR
jgi:hypothetical protein